MSPRLTTHIGASPAAANPAKKGPAEPGFITIGGKKFKVTNSFIPKKGAASQSFEFNDDRIARIQEIVSHGFTALGIQATLVKNFQIKLGQRDVFTVKYEKEGVTYVSDIDISNESGKVNSEEESFSINQEAQKSLHSTAKVFREILAKPEGKSGLGIKFPTATTLKQEDFKEIKQQRAIERKKVVQTPKPLQQAALKELHNAGKVKLQGIARNGTMDCWLISLMQMICHTKSLKKFILNKPDTITVKIADSKTKNVNIKPLKDFIQLYDTSTETIPNEKIHQLRSLFNDLGVKLNDRTQEDISEALHILLNELEFEGQLKMIRTGVGDLRKEELSTLFPQLEISSESKNLQPMLDAYFKKQPDSATTKDTTYTHSQNSYTSAPKFLPIQLKRFEVTDQERNITGKIKTSIEAPNIIKITVNGTDVRYKLKMVGHHNGSSLKEGHWTSALIEDDTAYILNDDQVSECQELPDKYRNQGALFIYESVAVTA